MRNKYVIPLVAAAFITVLFLNTYFNLTSGVAINKDGKTMEDKFYLSGPDPYYNMRILQQTLKTGKYAYIGGAHGEKDPFLNYPLGGSGGRPPLFTMVTIASGKFLSLFMHPSSAFGYSMQFLPALYGALIVIPVYFIGKSLFNKKVGIIASWIIPMIPIHLSSGHGSAYALYDTDSAILLLITTTLAFLIFSLKEKNVIKSSIFAAMSGIFASAIAMVWVAGQYIFALIAVYSIAQMIVDIFANKISIHIVRSSLIALSVGYIIAFPILWVKHGFTLDVYLFSPIAVAIFSGIYLWLGKKNIPWILSLPSIAIVAGAFLTFLYLIRNTTNAFLSPLVGLSKILYHGVYGNKTALTIAEASTFNFSRTVMSFGPVIYFLGWFGFFYLLYKYYKRGWKREYMVVLAWFAVETWLTSQAGRFLNDLVPLMAILGAITIWYTIERIDFKGMIKSLRGLGGGLYGIKKALKLRHVFGVIFIAFFIVFPNGWLAFDASIPSTMKNKFHTDKLGAFGLSIHTEKYWTDALSWLHNQTANYSNDKKPGFISWWDYGFYCVAVAKNPTVADNFQEGIPPAANFQTAESEDEAVAVWIVRLAQGDMQKHDGKISSNLSKVFEKYLGNESKNLTNILEEPTKYAPSYNTIIGEEYGGKKYRVREENAMYHDATKLLMKLDDENLTMLYREVQNVTGYSIRYYGVEGYDINIFNVFTFLADKGVYGYETPEDKYFKLWYVANKTKQKFTPDEVKNITQSMSREDIEDTYGRFIPQVQRKEPFYNSMTYRAYLGNIPKSIFENYSSSYQLVYYMNPTSGMKHFIAEYVSPVTKEKPFYFNRGSLCIGLPAVVIAKYYEGAEVKGNIKSEGQPISGAIVEVQKNVTIFGMNRSISHDITTTDANGNFNVIVPGGNVIIDIYNYDRQSGKKVDIKKVYLNISDEQAMRIKPWKIDIGTINVERGIVRGIVYWDKDGDGKYNASIDKKVDATVVLGSKQVSAYGGSYEIKHLIPSVYPITAVKPGYDVSNRGNVEVKPNATSWYNISLVPSKVEVHGKVWYDFNGNGRFDNNESISDAPITFTVIKAPDKNAGNDSTSSNSTGDYSITLFPATYRVVANYTSNKNNATFHYTYKTTIQIKIGDNSKTLDIKLRRE